MTYTITTVDWNKEQTELWLKYVNKNCPTANVVLVPDTRPIPWNWASGKLECFNRAYDTDRLIYVDTDTLILKDIEHLFDDMGDAVIGLSNNLSENPQHKRPIVKIKTEILSEYFDFKYRVEHFSSGLLVMRGDYIERLHSGWMGVMTYPPFVEFFQREVPAGEMALSYWLASDLERHRIYNIPLEVHGVLERHGRRFGKAEFPEVVHYHHYGLLEKHGFINDEIQRYQRGLEVISNKTVAIPS